MVVIGIIAAYLLIMNIIGFALMGIDKRRSVKRLWRISESTLFVVAIIGGSLGSIIGMRVFHHKTKHWYFVYGMPAILIIEVLAVVAFVYFSPIEFSIM